MKYIFHNRPFFIKKKKSLIGITSKHKQASLLLNNSILPKMLKKTFKTFFSSVPEATNINSKAKGDYSKYKLCLASCILSIIFVIVNINLN